MGLNAASRVSSRLPSIPKGIENIAFNLLMIGLNILNNKDFKEIFGVADKARSRGALGVLRGSLYQKPYPS